MKDSRRRVQLDISYDRFVRTTDARHEAVVRALLGRVWDADVRKAAYSGRYCVGCEEYKDDDDLDADGNCLVHRTPCPEREEARCCGPSLSDCMPWSTQPLSDCWRRPVVRQLPAPCCPGGPIPVCKSTFWQPCVHAPARACVRAALLSPTPWWPRRESQIPQAHPASLNTTLHVLGM